MTNLLDSLINQLQKPINHFFLSLGVNVDSSLSIPTQDGVGDLTFGCHKYSKALKRSPQDIAIELAHEISKHHLVSQADAVNGFLNLHLNSLPELVTTWALYDNGALGYSHSLLGQKYVIEYSSPNTNKPQHLGHCRNNILGQTVATLLRTAGAEVVRVNLINDRGIHICKSMWAWQQFGEGATPESTGIKGDHLVGDFYVRFNQVFEAEYKAQFEHTSEAERPSKDAWFNGESPIGQQVRAMLLAWEAGDPAVRALWRTMNGWCEAGFAATYARMGVAFDRIDKESTTYLLGKDLVEKGLKNEVFRHAANGAVVYDLARIGLEGEKAVLRADGTSVYMTQDLGTAMARFEDFEFDRMVYVVGNEQDHHFNVLFGVLGDLDARLKNRLFHLSYGMVELPQGRMKSREGTVVDADDLMDNLRDEALTVGRENWPDLAEDELLRRAEIIGLSGLKFYLLKFAPATTFTFDPSQSIKPEGETGVYCQYAYARATSILFKANRTFSLLGPDWKGLNSPQAKAVLTALLKFPGEVRAAAIDMKPSLVAKATYQLASAFSSFYNHSESRVLNAEPRIALARIALVEAVQRVLKSGLNLLGIEVLEEM